MNDKVKLELGKSPQNSVWYSPRINNELEQQVAHIEQEIVSVQEKVDVILTLLDHQKSKNTDPE